MDTSFALPVAKHVARREVGLALGRGSLALDGYEALQKRIVDTLYDRFASGRKLDDAILSGMLREIRSSLAQTAPIHFQELVRPPTRARPKGEAHEFLAAISYSASDDKGPLKAFVGLRIMLTRKRAVIDQEFLGISLTRHLFERAIERDLAAWKGGLRDVEEAVFALQGLVVIWRWAIISGRIAAHPNVNLPFGKGLILGQMRVYTAGDSCSRYVVNGRGSVQQPLQPNCFHTTVRDGKAHSFFEFMGSTTVNEDVLALSQIDLRDALTDLCHRHADLIGRLGRYATWTAPEMQPREGFFEVKDGLDRAADDLARIVLHPWLGQALDPALRLAAEAEDESVVAQG